jgi:hypothetical protein
MRVELCAIRRGKEKENEPMGNIYTVTKYAGNEMNLVRGEEIDDSLKGVYLTEEAAARTVGLLDHAVDTERCIFSLCWSGENADVSKNKILGLIKSVAECRNPVGLFVPEIGKLVLINVEAVETAGKVIKDVEESAVGDNDGLFTSFETTKALATFNMRRMPREFPFCVQKSVECYLFNDANEAHCYLKD